MDERDALWSQRAIRAFSLPMPIEAVEQLEVDIKRAWEPVIADAAPNQQDAFRFSEFFSAIGFVRKYKPYGTKFAAPFGFSIFALRNGCGFSVQLHRAAKVEAFHILAVGQDAFVLLCTPEEWRADGKEFLRLWADGRPTESALAFRPDPGDVIVIRDLEIVHSIIGCVLEEFATTSNDAVERLHDQNAGIGVPVPNRHASVVAALGRAAGVEPTRLVSRTGGSWSTAPLPGDDDDLVTTPGGRLRAGHLSLPRGVCTTLTTPEGHVATVACLRGEVQMELRGGMLRLGPGDLAPLAPGERATLTSLAPRSRLAVCRVTAELAFADLR